MKKNSSRAQRGQDLGQRMHHALQQVLKKADYAVLIGTDSVTIDAEMLRTAIQHLASDQDAVLSPTEDGGYFLVGLRKSDASIFRGIHWSTSSVMAATRRRLQRAGLSWAELPVTWDIDEPADVRRWKRQGDIL